MALSFSASSSTAGQQADELRRQNSALRTRAREQALEPAGAGGSGDSSASSSRRPGSIRYLHTSPGDAAKAAERLRSGELDRRTYVAAGRAGRGGAGDRAPTPPPPRSRRRRPRRSPRETPVEPEVAPTDAATAPVETETDRPAGRDRDRGRRRRRGRAVNLIDRRLGLLFAAFVVLLALVLVRAAWVQGINGGSAERRGPEPAGRDGRGPGLARNDLRPQRQGARGLRGRGDHLRHPVPGHRSGGDRAQAGQGARRLRARRARERSPTASPGSPTSSARSTSPDAEKVSELDLPGIGMLPDSRRIYPQGELAGQVIGTVGIDNQGLTGLEASEDQLLHGTDGEREVVRDGLGDELERNTIEGAADRLRPRADARRQPPGRDRAGRSPASARPTTPTGRPRSSWTRAAREILAMANWPGFDPSDPGGARPGGARQHGHRLQLRARLDLQGVHGRRRARAGAGDAEHDVRPAADDPGRRPGDRGVARARLRQLLGRRHPQVLLQRRRGQDRARARRRGLRPLDPQLRLRRADRRPVPGRGARDRDPGRRVLRLDDGQPADRPGPLGDPDADGRRLLGDRRRRRPAPAAAGALRGRRDAAAATRASG